MRAAFVATIFGMSVISAGAQAYPTKPISMVVPFAAGGPTDTVARLVAETMTRDLGQQVLIENVGGAGGTLGTTRVARAPADGYTLLLHHIGMSTAPTLYRKLPYDAKTAFEYVGLVTDVPMTIVARPDFPGTTLADVLTFVKEKKADATLANAGLGSASHLCGMLLMDSLKTPMTTVPYKGTAPAMQDVMGARVDLMCDQTTNTTSNIKANKIKVFAVTTPKRVPSLASVPTAAEAGLADFQVGIWHGIYAPKGTPAPVIDRLSASLKKALKDPAVVERFEQLGTVPVVEADATPAALKAKTLGEIDRWAPIIHAAGQYAE